MLVVLVAFTTSLPKFATELQYIEMFAGEANCWRAVTTAFPAARVDVNYFKPTPGTKEAMQQNPMDFLSSPGLAICVWLVLQAAESDFYAIIAVVCTSFCAVNVGTHKRSIAYPDGDPRYSYISDGNCMRARSCLLALLICARGGTFFLEQPRGSLMEYYDKLQWLTRRLPVYRIVWWMGLYKHTSPKRHKAFTNNKFCERYNLGRLKMHEFLKVQDPTKKTSLKYQDGQGRTRYKGNGKALKNSQTYPEQFGWHTVKNMPKFKTRGEGCPKLANEEALDGPQAFAEMSWGHDLDWSDARLLPAIVYLKGGTALKLPEKWKVVFPRHLDL